MTRSRALLGAVSLAVALAAFAAGASAETVRVTIKDLEFTPVAITVHVGDTIEWVNTDFIAHTATARNGAFDVTMEAGVTARAVVTVAGMVEYFCQYHPDMIASVNVLPK